MLNFGERFRKAKHGEGNTTPKHIFTDSNKSFWDIDALKIPAIGKRLTSDFLYGRRQRYLLQLFESRKVLFPHVSDSIRYHQVPERGL